MSPQVFSEEYIAQCLREAMQMNMRASKIWDFITDEPRSAAVLIPLFLANLSGNGKHGWHVLLTRRTNSVAEHQGQVAYPGGRADPTDISPESTALREAREEIGLDPAQVRILGRMQSLHTISNYLVTPIVGVIPWPFPVQLEETEVSRVFSVPLDWLANPQNHEVRNRSIPDSYANYLHSKFYPVIFYQPYQDEMLWGVSAEITLQLINILYKKKAGD